MVENRNRMPISSGKWMLFSKKTGLMIDAFFEKIGLMINPIFPKNPIGKIAVSLPRNQMISLVTGLFHVPRKLVPFRSFMMSLM